MPNNRSDSVSYQYLMRGYLYFQETDLVCKNCQKGEALIRKDCKVKKISALLCRSAA